MSESEAFHRLTAARLAVRYPLLHHDLAWARGGDDAADNLRLLCAPHNRLLAERDFGRAHVAQAIAAKPAAR